MRERIRRCYDETQLIAYVFVKENVTGDEDETTCISKLVVMGFTTALEGRKRSLEEQKAAQAGDWLNSK